MSLSTPIRQAILDNTHIMQILKRRIERRFYTLRSEIYARLPDEVKCKLDPAGLDRMESLFELFMGSIIDKELDRFGAELDHYKKKYRHDYFHDIEKAFLREKDQEADQAIKRSLVRILSWDKEWLSVEEVHGFIIAAQEDYDFDFLKDIGEAISLHPGCRPKPKADPDLKKRLQVFADRYPSRIKEPQFVRGMHDFLYRDPETDEVIGDDPKAFDPDYFVKWLKRNEVI